MPHITHGEQSLYYELTPCARTDSAPVLMLSNSLGADLTMWSAQMAAFTQSFAVLRYDPRGHGRSALAAAPFGIDDLGRDAVALIDALEIERVHFCGLSMGGQVGLWLGTNAQERLERLVICNSAARIGTAETWNSRIDAVRGGGMAAIADGVMTRWFTARFGAVAPQSVAALRQVLLATNPAGYMAACAALRDSDLRGAIAAIHVPTLVVSGTHDVATPVQDAYFLTEHIHHAQYLELDAAHISNIEQAAQFTSAVHGFLTGGH